MKPTESTAFTKDYHLFVIYFVIINFIKFVVVTLINLTTTIDLIIKLEKLVLAYCQFITLQLNFLTFVIIILEVIQAKLQFIYCMFIIEQPNCNCLLILTFIQIIFLLFLLNLFPIFLLIRL